METSVNNGMCRCCASEGAFKDVKSTYHWMGEEEIYADMLRDCFDINLDVSEQCEDGGICEVCITQLRNAINFKKQVLHTEDQFKKHLHNKALFRPNIVKVEVQNEDSDDDDHNASGDDAFSGDYEVPIKSEVSDEPKPKKRAAKAAMTTRSKKAKVDSGETSAKRRGCNTEINLMPDVSKILKQVNKSTSINVDEDNDDWGVTILKNNTKDTVKGKRRRIVHAVKREIDKHYENIQNILLHSNATPIRSNTGIGYSCGFCTNHFPAPKDLKTHTLETHDDTEKSNFMLGCSLSKYLVKLDITDLECNICGESLEGLETLMDHLQSAHDKVMHTDINNHILPFKFEGDALDCVICSKSYERFKILQEHMSTHYRNYVCDICDAPFVNNKKLSGHVARHKQGEFPCNFCQKIFDTHARKLHHEKFVHMREDKRNKCPYCDEKFAAYSQRIEHMFKEHGAQPKILKCNACDKTFIRKDRLSQHIKRDHLLERKFGCELCDMKFYEKKEVNSHMQTHTGIKKYTCDICMKSYGRNHTLKEHMRIHAEDRRYKCDQCGHAFIQKFSWKSHMKSKHGISF